ncbi:MAG: hypothetical protein QOH51_90 [Acidobacteriota bacterium]|jgi:hypothetical protein|nr:hypothetical protein [Acidobacteriota bacterium]
MICPADPLETVMKSDSNTTAESATTPPRLLARGLMLGPASREKPGNRARARSDAATLACAVSIAVALGIACGSWINAQLAFATSVVPPAPAQLMPVAHTAGQKALAPTAATELLPSVYNDTSLAADEATVSVGSYEPGGAEPPGANLIGTTDERPGGRRAAATISATREASPPARTTGRSGGTPGFDKKAAAGQGRVVPCALYASTGSLTIRNGGAATLVLGGPGESGHVTVTTPDWSDIALFSEGRGAGNNGWVRYSVRSVSKRAGVYTLRFTTSCGSKTIPVIVTRP